MKFIWLLFLLIPFMLLNLFQSKQYKTVTIHWDSMTKETYWLVFGKEDLNSEEEQKVGPLLDPPDYEAAKKGKNR